MQRARALPTGNEKARFQTGLERTCLLTMAFSYYEKGGIDVQLRSGILIHLTLPSTNYVRPLATDSKPEVFTVAVESGKAFEHGINGIHPKRFRQHYRRRRD